MLQFTVFCLIWVFVLVFILGEYLVVDFCLWLVMYFRCLDLCGFLMVVDFTDFVFVCY